MTNTQPGSPGSGILPQWARDELRAAAASGSQTILEAVLEKLRALFPGHFRGE